MTEVSLYICKHHDVTLKALFQTLCQRQEYRAHALDTPSGLGLAWQSVVVPTPHNDNTME